MNENVEIPPRKTGKAERLQNAGILFAIIVSISSLSLAIWQSQETSRLFGLHMRPIVAIQWDGYEDGSVVSLSNKGLAPALITSVELCYRDREIRPTLEELRDLLFNEYKLPNAKIEYQIWSDAFWLEAGQRTAL